jgi:hypothetical protein
MDRQEAEKTANCSTLNHSVSQESWKKLEKNEPKPEKLSAPALP